MAASKGLPLSPKEGWLRDGRRVLHFKTAHWQRWTQRLEVTSGELLPDQPVPLLKNHMKLTHKQATMLWRRQWQEGWRACEQQW